jgi:hypothetical protein
MRPGSALRKGIFVGSGVLALLVALVAGLAGGGLVRSHVSGRDADGYYATSATPFGSRAAALTSPTVALDGARPGQGWMSRSANWVTLRFDATAGSGKPLFLGIASENDIAAYLGRSSYDEVTDANFSSGRVTYRHVDGDARPAPPATRSIWAASVVGDGALTLTWPVETGRWGLVVMNADGSPGVDVSLALAAKTESLLPVGLGFIALAVVSLAGGVLLFRSAVRRPPVEPAPPPVRNAMATSSSAS